MQTKYQKRDIKKPINRFEGRVQKNLTLPQNLAEFQHMAYNLQLAEKTIDFPNANAVLWIHDIQKYEAMKADFEYFLSDLLDEDISITFVEDKNISSSANARFIEPDFEYLSLFSGGLDSISIPFQDSYKNKKGVLHHTITHNIPYGKAKVIFDNFFKNERKLTFTTSYAKNKVDDPSYLKTRGLIFLTNAMCVAAELRIREVIIPENGPFMMNIPISYNADPTRTADPNMIESWSELFHKITHSQIKISTPFKDMTKSEVILSTGKRDLIAATWSCSYFQGLPKMCGLCNSCLVRILSCHAIDEGENILEYYVSNPFTVNIQDLGEKNLESYRISLDAFEFWTGIIDSDHLFELDKQRFIAIRNNYPLMINHALDMMLGFEKLSKICNSSQPLFVRGQKLLKHIDKSLLEQRYQELMTIKTIRKWDQ